MSTLLAAGGNPLEFLTQFGIEWRLLVSQGISFAIVACALYYFAFKPVMAVADKRRETIEKGLKDASEAAEKLASAQAEADRKAAEAAKEATNALESARAQAKTVIEQATAAAAEKAAEIRRKSEEQLEQDRARMKRELEGELRILIAKAAEEAVGKILTAEQKKSLDELAVKELAEGK